MDDLNQYLLEAGTLIDSLIQQLEGKKTTVMGGWKELLHNGCRFNHRPTAGEVLIPNEDQLFYINVLWQAVRLCAVIHDIGHLPMSHVFEDAIKEFRYSCQCEGKDQFLDDYNRRKTQVAEKQIDKTIREEFFAGALYLDEIPFHEWWGFSVFSKAMSPDGKWSTSADAFSRLIYRLAKLVFLINRPTATKSLNEIYSPLHCLHTIVSGDLDADRLDYCVRDAMASGTEFGAIDVHRIIDSLVLCRPQGQFQVLPRCKALSALESFFHQRYLLYQYVIFHHNVVRMDGILRSILIAFLKEAVSPTASLVQDLLDCNCFWKKEAQSNGCRFLPDNDWNRLDDAWLRTLLGNVRECLGRETNLPEEHKRLFLLIETFLDRRSDNVLSIWKTDADFRQTLRLIGGQTGTVNDRGEQILQILRRGAEAGEQDYYGSTEPPIEHYMVSPLIKQFRSKGIHLQYRYLPPKIISSGDKAFKVLDKNGRILTAQELSPYLESLETVAAKAACFHFSIVHESIKVDPQLVSNCRNKIVQALSAFVAQRALHLNSRTKSSEPKKQSNKPKTPSKKARKK